MKNSLNQDFNKIFKMNRIRITSLHPPSPSLRGTKQSRKTRIEKTNNKIVDRKSGLLRSTRNDAKSVQKSKTNNQINNK